MCVEKTIFFNMLLINIFFSFEAIFKGIIIIMKTTNILKTICLLILLMISTSIYADNSPIDDEIVNVIQSELTLDEDLDSLDIYVRSHNGVVELQGEVDSLESRNRVIDIAQSTSGVIKVESSKLVINPY